MAASAQDVLELPLQGSPQFWGIQGFKHLEHSSLCPVSAPQGHRKADICNWEPQGFCWAPLPKALLCSWRNPCSSSLDKGRPRAQFSHSSSKHRAHVQAFPYISKFLSEGFSTLFSDPPAQGAVTNISSWAIKSRATHTVCTFFSFASSIIYFHKNWLITWSEL